jgi:tagatose 1,6-diphosphate aldolase GatY/KbaY
MLTGMLALLADAREGGYAIGAFNVYNLEGIRAVIDGAAETASPAMLQIHPSALKYGGGPLVAAALAAAREARTPVGVHLDHASARADIDAAIAAGVTSLMADGSHKDYAYNVGFTREIASLARAKSIGVEAELGRLTGTEDGLTVPEYESKLTDPAEAQRFVAETGVNALAVCIGNVHGRYPSEPRLDFDRLEALARKVPVPLVLHGASGLPTEMVTRAIEIGVCKFNVNTEVREAFIGVLKETTGRLKDADLVDVLGQATIAMKAVVIDKMRAFGSAGRAKVETK